MIPCKNTDSYYQPALCRGNRSDLILPKIMLKYAKGLEMTTRCERVARVLGVFLTPNVTPISDKRQSAIPRMHLSSRMAKSTQNETHTKTSLFKCY